MSNGPRNPKLAFPILALLLASILAPALSHAAVGEVVSETKISDTQGGFTGTLSDIDRFGECVAYLGDVDGDGVGDLVTSTLRPTEEGLAWILFMNANDTVKSHTAIGGGGIGGYLPETESGDRLGQCGEGLGDLNYDGVPDLAVMSEQGGENAVWILFLNTDGTVKSEQRIGSGDGGFPTGEFVAGDQFGRDIARLGDLDGDGVVDIAVGVPNHDDGGTDRGGVFVLFLEPDGYVKDWTRISDSTEPGLGLTDGVKLGLGVAGIGDLDGDGVPDLAAGAFLDDTGVVYVLLLNADGSVKSHTTIGDAEVGGGLNSQDRFGVGVAPLGDLDGDGVRDLAVGASRDDDGGIAQSGAVWVVLLNSNGTVKGFQKISASAGGFTGPLNTGDEFGMAVEGYRGADGQPRLAAGARQDDDGGLNRGALYILELDGGAQPAVCGDFLREAAEACDDGNTDSGDTCSATCEVEDLLFLRGTATGGMLSLMVSGELIQVTTSPGESAAQVLAAAAAAIDADPTLQGLGISAVANGGVLYTPGVISVPSTSDGGLVLDERADLTLENSQLRVDYDLASVGSHSGVATFAQAPNSVALSASAAGGFTAPANLFTGTEPIANPFSLTGHASIACAPGTHATFSTGSGYLGFVEASGPPGAIRCQGGLQGELTTTVFSVYNVFYMAVVPVRENFPLSPIGGGGRVTGQGVLSAPTFGTYPTLRSAIGAPWTAGRGWVRTREKTGTTIHPSLGPLPVYQTRSASQRGIEARREDGIGILNVVAPGAVSYRWGTEGIFPPITLIGTGRAMLSTLRLRFVPEPAVPLGMLVGVLGLVALSRGRRERR